MIGAVSRAINFDNLRGPDGKINTYLAARQIEALTVHLIQVGVAGLAEASKIDDLIARNTSVSFLSVEGNIFMNVVIMAERATEADRERESALPDTQSEIEVDAPNPAGVDGESGRLEKVETDEERTLREAREAERSEKAFKSGFAA